MTRALPPLAALCCAVLAFAGAPARAADFPAPPAPGFDAPAGGGFRVPHISARPAPSRYDIYGYPLLPGMPSPLAAGGGCPAALQPGYDPDGNLAGYAPIPMCR